MSRTACQNDCSAHTLQVHQGELQGKPAAIKVFQLEDAIRQQAEARLPASDNAYPKQCPACKSDPPRPPSHSALLMDYGNPRQSVTPLQVLLSAAAVLYGALRLAERTQRLATCSFMAALLQAKFRSEVQLLRACSDKNVVGFRGAAMTPGHLLMLMEVSSNYFKSQVGLRTQSFPPRTGPASVQD